MLAQRAAECFQNNFFSFPRIGGKFAAQGSKSGRRKKMRAAKSAANLK
jgi:hypothetical protein